LRSMFQSRIAMLDCHHFIIILRRDNFKDRSLCHLPILSSYLPIALPTIVDGTRKMSRRRCCFICIVKFFLVVDLRKKVTRSHIGTVRTLLYSTSSRPFLEIINAPLSNNPLHEIAKNKLRSCFRRVCIRTGTETKFAVL
ncbi:hypothetical protein L9F63_005832, partial [Diploptera punctata]